MLSDKQAKLVQFSEEIVKEQNNEEIAKVQERLLLEKKLRKSVHDAIVKLTEKVSDEELLSYLPYLDRLSWDDVVEERSIAKTCGFPLCDNENIPIQTQTYYIDRREKKIFEANKERNKFCSSNCFQRSAFVKAQLDEHPLWITGLNEIRSRKTYDIQHVLASETLDREFRRLKPVEIVSKPSTLVKSLNELKIAERAESDEEMSDEDGMATRDDQDFLESLERFIKQKPCQSDKANPFMNSSAGYQIATSCSPNHSSKSEKDKQKSPNNSQVNSDKEQKLQNIRSKYQQKKPHCSLLIEPLPIAKEKLKETVRAESSVPGQESYPDVEQGPSKTAKVLKSTEVVLPNQEDLQYVTTLFNNWWTKETTEIVQLGGRKPSSDSSRVLLAYMHGDICENANVNLPDVDSVDVRRKRLRILIESLKPTWLKMERFFGKTSSSSHCLVDLVSSFHLEPSNITGFERKHTQLIVSVLWKIACGMDSDLHETYFEQPEGSQVIWDYFAKISLNSATYERIVDNVMKMMGET
ncbi:unnamed protein product [Auanema sp. JU1783]|nr:unnamed protein product [Auanema sp. JU1783]